MLLSGRVAARARAGRRFHPAQVIFAAFATAVLAGTGLLALPIAKTGPGGASVVEALFTAVSAVAVTGHVIVDTPTFWTPFGQVVILVLIQLGGLGVMTFATFVGLVVVRRMSFRSRLNTATEAKAVGLDEVRGLVLGVVKVSLTIEAVVATILALRFGFGYGYSPGEAIWLGVFHGVSSFNNAGFALFSDSMMGFVADPVISLTICASIILGGLGFPVIFELRKRFRRPLLWSMNTRLVLVITPVLLVLGTLYITVLEWNNPGTLGDLAWHDRILAGFFQSVQTRTAG